MTLATPEAKALIDTIINSQEGGWKLTENANDPDGGWTYAGVTAKSFQSYLAQNNETQQLGDIKQQLLDAPEPADVKEVVYYIYYQEYYEPLDLDNVAANIRGPLFSCAVNIGVTRAKNIYDVVKQEFTSFNAFNGFLKLWTEYYIQLVVANADAWHKAALKQSFNPTIYRAGDLLGWFHRVEFWRTNT